MHNIEIYDIFIHVHSVFQLYSLQLPHLVPIPLYLMP